MRRRLAPFVVLTAVAALGLGAAACGGSSSPSGTIQGTITIGTDKVVTVSTSAGCGGSTGDAAAGKAVFTANCGGCHPLKDAGTSGQVGPDLDQLKPAAATVQTQVTNGGAAMPAFKGTLSDADIANVAAYVSSVAGQ